MGDVHLQEAADGIALGNVLSEIPCPRSTRIVAGKIIPIGEVIAFLPDESDARGWGFGAEKA